MPTSKSKPTVITILGIDPGYADLGYGVIASQENVLQYITCDNIKSSAKKKLADRILAIDKELEKIIINYKPNLVAIEKIFFFKFLKFLFLDLC